MGSVEKQITSSLFSFIYGVPSLRIDIHLLVLASPHSRLLDPATTMRYKQACWGPPTLPSLIYAVLRCLPLSTKSKIKAQGDNGPGEREKLGVGKKNAQGVTAQARGWKL